MLHIFKIINLTLLVPHIVQWNPCDLDCGCLSGKWSTFCCLKLQKNSVLSTLWIIFTIPSLIWIQYWKTFKTPLQLIKFKWTISRKELDWTWHPSIWALIGKHSSTKNKISWVWVSLALLYLSLTFKQMYWDAASLIIYPWSIYKIYWEKFKDRINKKR